MECQTIIESLKDEITKLNQINRDILNKLNKLESASQSGHNDFSIESSKQLQKLQPPPPPPPLPSLPLFAASGGNFLINNKKVTSTPNVNINRPVIKAEDLLKVKLRKTKHNLNVI